MLVVGEAVELAVAAVTVVEREILLVGGAGRRFLFLLREASRTEDIAAVGLVVLRACLDHVFVRFYLKNWSLFTYSVAFLGFQLQRVFSERGGDY